MVFYRFESNGMGIYKAVDIQCPQNDKRRLIKPDGAWLPKIEASYPKSISFWTELGLEKYLNSGLQEWHRSVVRGPLTIIKSNNPSRIFYEDEFQIICKTNCPLEEVAWEQFCQGHPKIPVVDKVVAYITRKTNGYIELLVFEHDKQWSEAGLQVPAGTVDKSEDVEAAVFREIEEEVGLRNLKLISKIDEYYMYRNTHEQFNRRHIYHLEATGCISDRWTHRVSGGGLDDGMHFHCFWLPIDQAEIKLSGSMGASVWKIL